METSYFGFNFNLEPIAAEADGLRNVLDEFGKLLYTRRANSREYLLKLFDKLDAAESNGGNSVSDRRVESL